MDGVLQTKSLSSVKVDLEQANKVACYNNDDAVGISVCEVTKKIKM